MGSGEFAIGLVRLGSLLCYSIPDELIACSGFINEYKVFFLAMIYDYNRLSG